MARQLYKAGVGGVMEYVIVPRESGLGPYAKNQNPVYKEDFSFSNVYANLVEQLRDIRQQIRAALPRLQPDSEEAIDLLSEYSSQSFRAIDEAKKELQPLMKFESEVAKATVDKERGEVIIGLAVWELAHILYLQIEPEHATGYLLVRWYYRHYFQDEFEEFSRSVDSDYASVETVEKLWNFCFKLAAVDSKNEVIEILSYLQNLYSSSAGPGGAREAGAISNIFDTVIYFIQHCVPTLKSLIDAEETVHSDSFFEKLATIQELVRDKMQVLPIDGYSSEVRDKLQRLFQVYAGEVLPSQSWIEDLVFTFAWKRVKRIDEQGPKYYYLRVKDLKKLLQEHILPKHEHEDMSEADEIFLHLFLYENLDNNKMDESFWSSLYDSDMMPIAVLFHMVDLFFMAGKTDRDIRQFYLSEYCGFVQDRLGFFDLSLEYMDAGEPSFNLIRKTLELWWANIADDEEAKKTIIRLRETRPEIYKVLQSAPSVIQSVQRARSQSYKVRGEIARAVYWACEAEMEEPDTATTASEEENIDKKTPTTRLSLFLDSFVGDNLLDPFLNSFADMNVVVAGDGTRLVLPPVNNKRLQFYQHLSLHRKNLGYKDELLNSIQQGICPHELVSEVIDILIQGDINDDCSDMNNKFQVDNVVSLLNASFSSMSDPLKRYNNENKFAKSSPEVLAKALGMAMLNA